MKRSVLNDLSRLLREPIFHFFIAGGLIMAVYSFVENPTSPESNIISIGPQQLGQLSTAFETTWHRSPSETELENLITDFVQGEIYYREALRLGLDRDDVVVRQRLRQKMEFLFDTRADIQVPSDSELQLWLEAHPEAYRLAPKIALQQVLLGESLDADEITGLLNWLNAEGDFREIGKRTLLPAQIGLSRKQTIDNIFGLGFFDRIKSLPTSVWIGPIESTYGRHFVRINDILISNMPSVDDVRAQLTADWSTHQVAAMQKQIFARLRSRYTVEVNGEVLPEITLQ